MDLIERYLVAVRRHLPAPIQDDIVQELGDSLRSEAEDHERATGHPLTEDEQAAMLKKRGHPWLMASRYLPNQHLIGPALYPYYRKALTIVVFWVVLPLVLFGGAITAIMSGTPWDVWGRMLSAAWNGSIYSVGIVTIVFAILEHEQVRIRPVETRVEKGPLFAALTFDWDPRRLPAGTDVQEVPRSETVIGMVFSLTFLVWWVGLVRVPEIVFLDGDAVSFTRGPIWSQLYYPILASLVASLVIYLIDLVRPWRTVPVTMADIIIGLANIAIIVFVLRHDGPYVNLAADPQFAERVATVTKWVNVSVVWTFAVIGVVTIWDVLSQLWRLTRSRRVRPTFTIDAKTI
jgi:hypothetical protein